MHDSRPNWLANELDNGLGTNRGEALRVDPEVLASVTSHALADYPEEAASLFWTNQDGVVVKSAALENLHLEPTKGASVSRTAVDELQCRTDKNPFRLAGFYHSHIDQSAALSWRDFRLAFEFAYLWIISVDRHGVHSISAYQRNTKNCVEYVALQSLESFQ